MFSALLFGGICGGRACWHARAAGVAVRARLICPTVTGRPPAPVVPAFFAGAGLAALPCRYRVTAQPGRVPTGLTPAARSVAQARFGPAPERRAVSVLGHECDF